MTAQKEYWLECVQVAAEECGAPISQEQARYIADAVQGGHENYGMAFYQPESPFPREIKELKAELKKERSKVVCPECRGRGRLEYMAGPWHVSSGCGTCHGDGRVLP